MTTEELKQQIGIDINTLYQGSFGLWINRNGVLIKIFDIYPDLPHLCWVSQEHGTFKFSERGKTWAIKRKEFEKDG